MARDAVVSTIASPRSSFLWSLNAYAALLLAGFWCYSCALTRPWVIWFSTIILSPPPPSPQCFLDPRCQLVWALLACCPRQWAPCAFLLLLMRHCRLFLLPLTLGSALSSLTGVGVATISSRLSSEPYAGRFIFPLAISFFPRFSICCREISKSARGKSPPLLFCTPQHVLLLLSATPSTLRLSASFSSSPLLSTRPSITDSHPCFRSRRTELIAALAKFNSTSAVLLPCIQSIYPSSSVLLTSLRAPPFSSSFQFPLLKWDVVYRVECVHALSPALVLGGGKWVHNETESNAVQTHNHLYLVSAYILVYGG